MKLASVAASSDRPTLALSEEVHFSFHSLRGVYAYVTSSASFESAGLNCDRLSQTHVSTMRDQDSFDFRC